MSYELPFPHCIFQRWYVHISKIWYLRLELTGINNVLCLIMYFHNWQYLSDKQSSPINSTISLNLFVLDYGGIPQFSGTMAGGAYYRLKLAFGTPRLIVVDQDSDVCMAQGYTRKSVVFFAGSPPGYCTTYKWSKEFLFGSDTLIYQIWLCILP